MKKFMANLICRVLYRYWAAPLGFRLIAKALDAQYPSIMVKVTGNSEAHHLVALTKHSMLFILKKHNLATELRSTMVPFTYAEYRELEERLSLWVTSEPYKKIQQGIAKITAMSALGANGKVRLRLPDDNANFYTTTAAHLDRQLFMRALLSCTHALWLIVIEDLAKAKAYLPHEVKLLALEAA